MELLVDADAFILNESGLVLGPNNNDLQRKERDGPKAEKRQVAKKCMAVVVVVVHLVHSTRAAPRPDSDPLWSRSR